MGSQDKLRKHKDEAVRQMALGRVKEALDELLAVQKLEPQDLSNRQKIGDLWRKLGNNAKAIESYQAVAGAYAADGLLLKAIAVCKLILQVDANHRETQLTLAELYGKKRGDFNEATMPAAMSAAVPPPLPSGKKPASSIRGVPISRIPLKSVMPAHAKPAVPLDPVEAVPLPESAEPLELEPLAAVPGVELAPAVVPLPQIDLEPLPEELPPDTGRLTTAVPLPDTPELDLPSVEGEVMVDAPPPALESLPVLPGAALPENGPAASWSMPPPPAPVAVPDLPAGLADGMPVAGPPGLEDIEMPTDLAPVEVSTSGTTDPAESDFGGLLDDTPATPAKVDLDKLPPIPLFNDLSKNAFIELMERMEARSYAEGATVIQEGEQGNSFFIIISGSVRVLKQQGDSKVELALLSDGAFFGEMALLSDAPRTAAVVAVTDCELFEISRATLDAVTASYPSVKQVMNNFYKQRLLSNLLHISPIFAPFSRDEQRELIGLFKSREVQSGEVILTEGQKGDGLYVVLSGRCVVTKQGAAGLVELARLKEGDVFGEMSLVTHAPVSASVAATTRVLLLRLPRKQFNEVIMTHPQVLETVSELTAQRQQNQARLAETRPGTGGGLV